MLSADFETAIAAIIKNLVPHTTLLASVSGGADSTAMLAALAAIRDNPSSRKDGAAFDLRCIHIEHGIRPAVESRGDAEFVRSLCRKLKAPCRVVSIAPGKIAAVAKRRGIGIEAAARLYRHKAWKREVRLIETTRLGFSRAGHSTLRQAQGEPSSGAGAADLAEAPVRILTAHTADDMLETVLMRVLRGSGPAGLAAMPLSRGLLLRPLLALTRRDVLNYLSDNNISYREDSTNTDTAFLRNRIRLLLIPQLSEHFPQWRGGVVSLAETQSLAAEFVKNEAKNRIKWDWGSGIGDRGKRGGKGEIFSTDARNFFAQPAIIREEALFQGINRLGISGKIKRANIRRFAQGNLTAVDLGLLQIRKDTLQVTISAAARERGFESFPDPHSEYGFSLLIKTPGSYNLKGIGINVIECSGLRDSASSAAGAQTPINNGQGGFFALLPLVLRPRFRDDFIERDGRKTAPGGGFAVVDSQGVAAFIGFDGLLQRRDDEAVQGEKRCMVRVRGIDAQRQQ